MSREATMLLMAPRGSVIAFVAGAASGLWPRHRAGSGWLHIFRFPPRASGGDRRRLLNSPLSEAQHHLLLKHLQVCSLQGVLFPRCGRLADPALALFPLRHRFLKHRRHQPPVFTSRNSVNHRQSACDFVGEPVGVTGAQREREIQLATELSHGNRCRKIFSRARLRPRFVVLGPIAAKLAVCRRGWRN